MAPRKPRAKKEDNSAIAGILNALKFCEPASKEIGAVNQTHIRLANNWAVAFDGVIAIGHKIDTDIIACPHTKTLITALSKCTDATQITQLGDGRLSIQSGRFRTFVPCLQPDLLGIVAPDQPCANINAAVVNSLLTVGPIAKENAQRIVLTSVLLRAGSAIATDGQILMESWHGVDLPRVIVPKAFITVLSKIQKVPTYFGFSQNSITFYFEDGSWIRTQLYSENWPDIDRILNTECQPWPIPIGLAEGLAKISNLDYERGNVYFGAKAVRTHQSIETGAICEIDGSLPEGVTLKLEHLQLMLTQANKVDFQAGERKDIAVFYGQNFRGMLVHSKNIATESTISTAPNINEPSAGSGVVGSLRRNDLDDEIPY